ncbi:DUF4124 domain-containing protein [Microbulbifer sp. SA54]|uniref:DUF4124 domain-containing protein n=1 Tax=Microbulbifer sp. SA54 TaxID=3401577 RepID=UPI003AB07B5F
MQLNKALSLCLFIWSSLLAMNSQAFFKCVDDEGQTKFQDRPCAKDESMEEIKSSNATDDENRKKELITNLAKSIGRDIDPSDPEALQAAEALLVTDAAKSYAYTKIFGISLEFCPNNKELAEAMENFKRNASDSITLGSIYYRDGYDLTIGKKRFNHTGRQLTDGLDGMLNKLRKEHERSRETKCRESVQALRSLAKLYNG